MYFIDHSIPSDLVQRAKHSLKMQRSMRERHVKEKDVDCFRFLPKRILQDLREEAFLPYLMRHPFFETWSFLEPFATRELCSRAVEEVYVCAAEEVFCDGQPVNRMIFVIDGELQYCHVEGDNACRIRISRGEWCCEACLWAVHASLSGQLMPGPVGCEVLKVVPVEFQEIARQHPATMQHLVKYAENFVQVFNSWSNSTGEQSIENILFNDVSVIEDITQESIYRAGKRLTSNPWAQQFLLAVKSRAGIQ